MKSVMCPPTDQPMTSKRMMASWLRNLSNKILTTRSHKEFLSACSKEHLIPKGL